MPFELSVEFRGRRFAQAARGVQALADSVGVDLGDLSPAIRREMRDFLDTVAEAMRQRHSTPWAPSTRLPAGDRSGRLARRSGDTVRAIKDSVRVSAQGREVTGSIGGPFYLVTHEEGRTIAAKNKFVRFQGERTGPWLFVPLPAALTARGTPRRINWRRTFIYRSKKNREELVIARRRPGGFDNLFVLKKSVRVPRRLGLGTTLEVGSSFFAERVLERVARQITGGS